MIVRYCVECGTPNSIDPASRRRAYCFGCGELLSLGSASQPDLDPASENQDGLGSPADDNNRVAEPAPPPRSDGRWLYTATVTVASEPAAPPIAAVAMLQTDDGPPAPRRFARLQSSAGFGVSTVVHTIAFVVLSLLIVHSPERAPVMNFVSSRPAHQAEETLDVMEFQAVEVEATVESVAQVSHEEMLASATETATDIPVEEPGLSDAADVGQFTLPEGLLAERKGGGRGGLAAGSATFSKRLRREKAKSGDVQVSLLWNNFNDIDVHVRCPSGELISFDHRKSRCRGELDVDMNARGPESDEPVENIFWPAGKAPFGDYHVVIHHYRNHGDPDPTPFEVQVKVDGRVRKFQGELAHGDPPLVIYHFHRSRGGQVEDDFYVE